MLNILLQIIMNSIDEISIDNPILSISRIAINNSNTKNIHFTTKKKRKSHNLSQHSKQLP